MKSVVIIIVAVLVIGGGAWLLTGTEWGREVLHREEVFEEGLREIEMDKEELMGILVRAEGVTSLSYDVEMESPEMTMKGSFWQKGQKIRAEGEIKGEEMVIIIDNEERVAYTYIPAQDFAVKMGLGEMEEAQDEVEEVQEGSIKEQSIKLPEQRPVVKGIETIEGKECIVVEYTVDEETTGKMWIWREYGLPIRVEVEDMVVRATNIDFGEVSDDKFKLPPGVEPLEIPDLPIGIPVDDFDLEDFDIEDFDIDQFDIDQFDIDF